MVGVSVKRNKCCLHISKLDYTLYFDCFLISFFFLPKTKNIHRNVPHNFNGQIERKRIFERVSYRKRACVYMQFSNGVSHMRGAASLMRWFCVTKLYNVEQAVSPSYNVFEAITSAVRGFNVLDLFLSLTFSPSNERAHLKRCPTNWK